jgi:hypothetical protein
MNEVEAELKKLAGEVKMAIVQNESFLRDSLSATDFLAHDGAGVRQHRGTVVRPPTAIISRVASAQGED